MMHKRRPFNIAFACSCLLVPFGLRSVLGEGRTVCPQAPPPGAIPNVDAIVVERVAPWYRVHNDEPALRPNHPPFDEIPPMPFPVWENFRGSPESLERDDAIPELPEACPGHAGVYGDYGGEDGIRTFGNLSHVVNTTARPQNVKLVIRFDKPGFNLWVTCSGSMIDAETVLTAGHCLFRHDNWGRAEEVWVYPAWDGVGGDTNPPPAVINPYGFAHSPDATQFQASTGWTKSELNLDEDIGVIRVTRAVGMLTGWFGTGTGGDCTLIKSRTYFNASYPGEDCDGGGPLHNGRDMYFWSGQIDSCPDNQLQVDVPGTCLNGWWQGTSGSGVYFLNNGSRTVHAVASHRDGDAPHTWGRSCRIWEDWFNFMNNVYIPASRGASFDLQALDVNVAPAAVNSGDTFTQADFLAANPTNGTENGTWDFKVYLSSDENITASDTLLSTMSFDRNFAAMSSVRVSMHPNVTIPVNTPTGTYWVGVILDSATDGDDSNNATHGWDATRITVTCPPEAACVSGIPTVSNWGAAALVLLVLTAGTIVFRRAKPTRA